MHTYDFNQVPYFFSLGAGVIVTIIFLFYRSKGPTVKRLFLKIASSLCYLLTAVFAVISNPNVPFYCNFIMMGGVLGLSGDIALDLKYIYPKDANEYLKSGFIFFLIGHVFYSTAIVYNFRIKWWITLICFAAAALLSACLVLSANILKVHYGKYRRIVFIYTTFLFMTTISSIVAAFMTHETSMIIMSIGAVSFALSDAILNNTYFSRGWDKPIHIFLNHLLYYIGQYMIAASIIFVK